MHTRSIRQRFTAVLGALIVLSLLAIPATANHSWGKYHVARPIGDTTATAIKLNVGDNVNETWDFYLDKAIGDWNQVGTLTSPDRIALLKVTGGASGDCGPTEGRIEV